MLNKVIYIVLYILLLLIIIMIIIIIIDHMGGFLQPVPNIWIPIPGLKQNAATSAFIDESITFNRMFSLLISIK